jgi:hypothetical protein
VDRPNRTAHRQRIRTRLARRKTAAPGSDCGSPDPQSSQPRNPPIQIDVTFTLSRPLGWLMAGIAIGNLRPPDGLLEKASLILRALLPG